MIPTYIEHTPKRTLVSALDWPGWTRGGRDEAGALQALLDYAPRYARILSAATIDFTPPTDVSDFHVVERKPGDATTEFGAPSIAATADERPISDEELAHMLRLLDAYWHAFDAAVAAAQGKELRKGPRGGGRELDKIVEHVVGAEQGYLSSLAWKWDKAKNDNPYDLLAPTRQAVRDGLTAAARDETPRQRPRGGRVWLPRYFVRRLGWHVLDHIWEIEDRLVSVG